MDRETKEIKSGNHTVIVKTYLTAGERRVLRNVLLANLKFDLQEEKPDIKDFSPELLEQIENKTIEQVIVSFDGSSENILQRMLELKEKEFDDIMIEINKIAQGENFKEVKKK